MSRPRTASKALLALLVLLAPLLLAVPARADVPSEDQWLADTRAGMAGSRTYVHDRVDGSAVGRRLAVNLDIDNTSLASHYEFGAPVPVVLRFARYARTQGVLLLFNTGRLRGDGRLVRAKRQLAAAGYRVTELCGRRPGETLVQGKQRCRRHFVAEGYTIVANLGNRPTDFRGGNYERAFRLPDYDGQLA